LLSKENLWKVFKYLDTNGTEVLTYDSLKQAFQRKGDFDEDLFNSIMLEVSLSPLPLHHSNTFPNNSNSNNGQSINFERFCFIMGLQ